MPLIFDKYSINIINGPYQMNVLIQDLDIPINNTIILFASTIKSIHFYFSLHQTIYYAFL